jgi:hypothetical protein
MDRSATVSGVSIDECKLSSRVAQVAQLSRILTGGSSTLGPLRPFNCSGLGVWCPCSEFIELFTLLAGVVCCTAPFSLIMRPLELLWRDDCDPATPFFSEASLVAWILSAFFLLLKRNAIVPFEAGNLVNYTNARQNLRIQSRNPCPRSPIECSWLSGGARFGV